MVITSAPDVISEDEYKEKLEMWKSEVAQQEVIAQKQFLDERLAWVCADDAEKIVSKSRGLSIVNEKKRKLFYQDSSVSLPFDWDRTKRQRKPCSHTPISGEYDHEIPLQVYSKIRTEDEEKKSTDRIVILTPAPPLHHCDNTSLKNALQACKMLTP